MTLLPYILSMIAVVENPVLLLVHVLLNFLLK